MNLPVTRWVALVACLTAGLVFLFLAVLIHSGLRDAATVVLGVSAGICGLTAEMILLGHWRNGG